MVTSQIKHCTIVIFQYQCIQNNKNLFRRSYSFIYYLCLCVYILGIFNIENTSPSGYEIINKVVMSLIQIIRRACIKSIKRERLPVLNGIGILVFFEYLYYNNESGVLWVLHGELNVYRFLQCSMWWIDNAIAKVELEHNKQV